MEILIKPIVTEKVTSGNEKGKYGFVVHTRANKVQIKNAVEKAYGVNVQSVRTMNYAGQSKSRYSKSKIVSGRTPSFKKAIVTVASGEVIDFYSNI